jgi:hypothetical protein
VTIQKQAAVLFTLSEKLTNASISNYHFGSFVRIFQVFHGNPYRKAKISVQFPLNPIS